MKKLSKILTVIMLSVVSLTLLTGCGAELIREKRSLNREDMGSLYNGEYDEITERARATVNESQMVFDERQGVMVTKTASDAYMLLDNLKFYCIAGALACFGVGLLMKLAFRRSSMTLSRIGSFMMMVMPLIAIGVIVITSFVVDVAY